MVTYQFEMDDDEWQEWKRTVPRTKSLDDRLRELIRADANGRVSPAGEPAASTDTSGDDPDTADSVGDREGFTPPVPALEFDKQATDRRHMVVDEWLQHVRHDGRVQKSDFETWYTDDHADRTGYEPGGFWDFFIKPAMRQVEGIAQPNSRTYVWEGPE